MKGYKGLRKVNANGAVRLCPEVECVNYLQDFFLCVWEVVWIT